MCQTVGIGNPVRTTEKIYNEAKEIYEEHRCFLAKLIFCEERLKVNIKYEWE